MFRLTQTAVKDFEQKTTCPLRWKSQWIDRQFKQPESLHMLKGKYFEYLLFGANAKQEDIPVLPPLKNGKPSIDQLRIEAQAKRIKPIIFEKLLSANPSTHRFQLHLVDKDTEGTIDIADVEPKNFLLADVKLTFDITATRTEHGWGHPWERKDIMQLIHYGNLMKSTYFIKPKLFYIVADYSPSMRFEISEIIPFMNAERDYLDRFQAARDAITWYNSSTWPAYPEVNECSICPLKCDKRVKDLKL